MEGLIGLLIMAGIVWAVSRGGSSSSSSYSSKSSTPPEPETYEFTNPDNIIEIPLEENKDN